MRILTVTDIHEKRATLERILRHAGPVDVVMFGGDITDFGTPAAAETLIRMAQAAAAQVFAVAGNCDSAEIERHLVKLDVSLFRCGRTFRGVGFHGLSAMPPWRPVMYQFTEEELAQHLKDGQAQLNEIATRVVLSHPPPQGTSLDLTGRGQHVGSKALREHIERTQPTLVLCGHIHEGKGIDRLGPTTVVNCGAAAHGWYCLAETIPELNIEIRHA